MPALPPLRWDLFCHVIDNHGDLGVCWRLARDLVRHGQRVRLWVDDASALAWMAPGQTVSDRIAPEPPLQVLPWQPGRPADAGGSASPPRLGMPCPAAGDVLVEAFGCEPPAEMIAAYAAARHPVAWINLEYLSAEAFVERNHALPSPVQSGPGHGLNKHFYYPGFSARTGGLIREDDLPQRQSAVDRARLRKQLGTQPGEQLASLFCYEPAALPALLRRLADGPHAWRLLVTPGRATLAVHQAVAALDRDHEGWNAQGHLRLQFVPARDQDAFDDLLWACDLNFVRGEDSLVRAIWAGRPFVWQLYPQADGAHLPKLQAFLTLLRAAGAGADVADWFETWNADVPHDLPPASSLSPPALAAWAQTVHRVGDAAAAHGSLTPRLIAFAASHPAR